MTKLFAEAELNTNIATNKLLIGLHTGIGEYSKTFGIKYTSY